MSNYILGSGIVGLLARHILGPSYILIPFKKSRYFSPQIPLSDNDIVYDTKIESIFSSLSFVTDHSFYSTSISYGGQLMFNRHIWSQLIIDKMYGENQHPHAKQLLSNDTSAFNVTAKELYDVLLGLYKDEIMNNVDLVVSSISDHKIATNHGALSYDNIISTIPMNVLLALLGKHITLFTKDYYVFLIATDSFDLEGSKRCFIADSIIPFWKVNVLAGHVYQFFSNEPVGDHLQVFSMMTRNRFRVLSSTHIQDAFPAGPPPYDLYNDMDKCGIKCIGSNAAHDYFIDISTSMAKLCALKK